MSTMTAMAEPGLDIATALHRIEMHEKVCTERHGNIWQALNDVKTAIANVQKSVSESNTQQHSRLDAISTETSARLNALSARQWGILVWVAAAATMGLLSMVGFLLLHR